MVTKTQVHIVMAGIYDECGVHSVFTSKKKADKMAALLETQDEKAWVETHDINVLTAEHSYFNITLNKDGDLVGLSGNVTIVEEYAFTPFLRQSYFECNPERVLMSLWVKESNRESAIKYAQSIRTQLITHGLWPKQDIFNFQEVVNNMRDGVRLAVFPNNQQNPGYSAAHDIWCKSIEHAQEKIKKVWLGPMTEVAMEGVNVS